MTSSQRVDSASPRVDALDSPAETATTAAVETPATSSDAPAISGETPATPTTPEAPTPETFVEAEAHAAVNEPLAITREVEQAQVIQDTAPPEAVKDVKAS